MNLPRLVLATATHTPGVNKAVSFYRHITFNLPRLVTAAGIALLLGIAAVRLVLLAENVAALPRYLSAYFALIGLLATLAALGMLVPILSITRVAWGLGSLVALASLLMYIASRTAGLPQLPQLVGRWDYAPGTFAMALSGAYLATHFSVLTRMNVAFPDHQRWHD